MRKGRETGFIRDQQQQNRKGGQKKGEAIRARHGSCPSTLVQLWAKCQHPGFTTGIGFKIEKHSTACPGHTASVRQGWSANLGLLDSTAPGSHGPQDRPFPTFLLPEALSLRSVPVLYLLTLLTLQEQPRRDAPTAPLLNPPPKSKQKEVTVQISVLGGPFGFLSLSWEYLDFCHFT